MLSEHDKLLQLVANEKLIRKGLLRYQMMPPGENGKQNCHINVISGRGEELSVCNKLALKCISKRLLSFPFFE